MLLQFVVGSRPCSEVFLRVLWFSPLLKNQHFQIPIRFGKFPQCIDTFYKMRIVFFRCLKERFIDYTAVFTDDEGALFLISSPHQIEIVAEKPSRPTLFRSTADLSRWCFRFHRLSSGKNILF